MPEWLEKLNVIWEWSRFYPTPARYFFGLTAGFIGISALLFFLYRGSASVAKAASDFTESIPLSVDADTTIPAVQVPEENGIPNDRALRYQVDVGAGVTVNAVLPYLDQWNSGQEIEALNIKSTRFRWRFPVLDIRFSNNTDKPLILNKVVVEAVESVPEDNPLISVVSDFDSQMGFRILTPIPKELSNCNVEYNVALTPGVPATQPYAFKKALPTLTGNDELTIDDALAGVGASPDVLRSDPIAAYRLFMTGQHVPAMGPLKKGTTVIKGQLTVKRGERVLGPFKFNVEVAMIPPGPQVLLPPSATYDAMLREYGKNYNVEVKTANQIPPKQSERIQLQIAAPRSSYHEFRLHLFFHDGHERVSDVIKLHLLRPD